MEDSESRRKEVFLRNFVGQSHKTLSLRSAEKILSEMRPSKVS